MDKEELKLGATPAPDLKLNKNVIKVSKKQEANPLLKFGKFHYVFSDDKAMPEDYDINEKVSLLFLSLTYHLSYPLYIVNRLDELHRQRKGKNRILLVLCDNPDEQNMINGLTIQTMKFDTTMIMCWSYEEAAQYILTMKSYENKTQTILEGF